MPHTRRPHELRARSRAAPGLCILVAGAIVLAACTDVPTGPRRARAAGGASALTTELDGSPCMIGKIGPPDWPGWFGTESPTSDTTCGITWTMSTPPLTAHPLEWYFLWADSVGVGQRATTFRTSRYNDLQNGPITLRFSRAVRRVSVRVWAEQGARSMTAFDSSGGVLWGVPINELTAIEVPGIRRVEIYPAYTGQLSEVTSGDSVVYGAIYQLSIVPDAVAPPDSTCPTGDPVLDDPQIRSQLVTEFNSSRANANIERAGYIYRDLTTGRYFLQSQPPQPGLTFDQCTSMEVVPPPEFPGAAAVAYYHVHGISPGQPFNNCSRVPPGWLARRGPSSLDYRAANATPGYTHYIIDERDVYRIWANMPRSEKRSARNRFNWNQPGPACRTWA